jgi:predicted GNAT family N-acyltransferase
LNLRETILRKPLGLSLSVEDIKNEDKQIHIGAFLNDEIIGYIILSPQTKTEIKMRQVVVVPEMQKTGIGKKLISFSEKYALDNGFSTIILNARIIVKNFYTKLGYSQTGQEFIEKNIPHIKMYKKLFCGHNL